ncbi:hypothetical protein FHT02_003700 [Sphingomonas xinjiangensis]|uniref:Uncharacterized protein n=1 Tax=Sphingomonas xinjiangensis TaxID=643568 RepID=A0A840YRY9_9SPHN|nr:hypothetical protein [Sphingomonas xinjiangensis]
MFFDDSQFVRGGNRPEPVVQISSRERLLVTEAVDGAP